MIISSLQLGCLENLRKVEDEWQRAWRMDEPQPVSEWAEESVVLDATVEGGGNFYDTSRRPWWKTILESLADPEVRSVSVAAGTQIGKTLNLQVQILWAAEHAPAPGMVVLPDQTSAIEFRDRIYANAKTSNLKRVTVPPEWKWNSRYIDLGTMRVYLAWSGSRQRLRGRPCRYVWLSEVDAYRGAKKTGDPVAAAKQRTGAFFRWWHYLESSPAEYPSEICELERQADSRQRWQCQCPHCGHWQEMRFFPHKGGPFAERGGIVGYRDPRTKELLPKIAARQAAHYLCEQGCKIENSEIQPMLRGGQWIPFGAIIRDGKLIGDVPPSRKSLGFHLWAIFSESISLGDIAEAYVSAVESGKVKEFFGNWLGLEWRPENKIPAWHVLGQRSAASHCRGDVPKDAWFLTAGVDVQGENNGIRYIVRGWGPGRTSWLIDWGWIDRDEGDENELIRSDVRKFGELILDSDYRVYGGRNPLGRSSLKVKLANIDSNHVPLKVHEWMRSLPESWVYGEQPRVRAIRGDHKVSSEMRWRKKVLDTNTRTGEVYEGGLIQWGLSVYPFYAELLDAINSDPNKAGAWYTTRDCVKLGKNYLEQVTNFGPVSKLNGKTGRKETFWDSRNKRIPVDFWDCEIYALVAAHMVVGDLGWGADAWERWKDSAVATARQSRRVSTETESLVDR
jgi:hypothetical protein